MTKPTADQRARRVVEMREMFRGQGYMAAAAFMGAATKALMKASSPPEVWDLDDERNPTARDDEGTAFVRWAEERIEKLRQDLDEDPEFFYGVVQEAAQLALADLGFTVRITRVH